MTLIKIKYAAFAAGSLLVLGGMPFVSLAQAPPTAIQAPMPAAPPSKVADTGDSKIAKATVNYRAMIAGYQSGANTGADLDRAAIALAEAHLHSDAPNTPNETLSNLNLIASLRAELFRMATAKYHAGANNFAEVKQANAALMEANARASLYRAVTFQDGTDLKQAVDEAAIVLQHAHDLKGDGQISVNSNDPK